MKCVGPDLSELLKMDHYSDENGNMAFTERFLLKRGICCARCRKTHPDPCFNIGDRTEHMT